MNQPRLGCALIVLGAVPSLVAAAPQNITVTVTNLSPTDGTYITPVFLATHDGTFDTFDSGVAASAGVERIAEDGDTGPLTTAAMSSGVVAEVHTAGGAPIAPTASVSAMFTVDSADPLTQYLSFLSMVVPSNDAFMGNGDPLAIDLFDGGGNLIVRQGAGAIVVLGSMVWDAGTEVNDEIPANTAFLAQMTPNTGVDENGVVHAHMGFQGSMGLSGSIGNILTAFPGADFTAPGYQVARIEITPEPASVLLLAGGAMAMIRRRRRA